MKNEEAIELLSIILIFVTFERERFSNIALKSLILLLKNLILLWSIWCYFEEFDIAFEEFDIAFEDFDIAFDILMSLWKKIMLTNTKNTNIYNEKYIRY